MVTLAGYTLLVSIHLVVSHVFAVAGTIKLEQRVLILMSVFWMMPARMEAFVTILRVTIYVVSSGSGIAN